MIGSTDRHYTCYLYNLSLGLKYIADLINRSLYSVTLTDLLEVYSLIKRVSIKINEDSDNEKTYLYENGLLFCIFSSDLT